MYRTTQDAATILQHKGNIRLVKGGYKALPPNGYKNKQDVDKHYVHLLKLCLTKSRFTALATHDEKIIILAKVYIHKHRIPRKKYEFEMLYGIRPRLQEHLAHEGHPVRVYVPYGKEWFPYFYRRIRERKENLFFVLKHFFRK